MAEQASAYEQRLRKRVKFYLPPALTVYLMVGSLVLAADAGATRAWEGVAGACFWEAMLTANLIVRRRYKEKLRRFESGLCPECGYDLRASGAKCPECGWVRGE